MASLKRLLRSGRTVWLAAALAVACSPAAASATSESGAPLVDDHAGAAPLGEIVIAPSGSPEDAHDASTGDARTDAEAPPSSTQDLATAEREATGQAALGSDDVVRPAVSTETITTTVGVTGDGEASVTAKASPNVVCAITASGAGRVPGLDAKQTDSTGNVIWTWTVAGTPTSSQAARVECSNADSIEVVPAKTDRGDQPERTLQRETRGPGEVHERDLERRSGPRS